MLRERVTFKGGMTYAAITSMEASDMKALFEKALFAAQTRAAELGQEFGRYSPLGAAPCATGPRDGAKAIED